MPFKSDIEIAQEAMPLKITEVAKRCGVEEEYLEQYGSYKAEDRLSPAQGLVGQAGRQADSCHRHHPHPGRGG